jgi:hypothetical protein
LKPCNSNFTYYDILATFGRVEFAVLYLKGIVVIVKPVSQKFALMKMKSFGSKRRPRYEVAMSVNPDGEERLSVSSMKLTSVAYISSTRVVLKDILYIPFADCKNSSIGTPSKQ